MCITFRSSASVIRLRSESVNSKNSKTAEHNHFTPLNSTLSIANGTALRNLMFKNSLNLEVRHPLLQSYSKLAVYSHGNQFCLKHFFKS